VVSGEEEEVNDVNNDFDPNGRQELTDLWFDSLKQLPDSDPQETQEWIESVQAVLDKEGEQRTRYLLWKALRHARLEGVDLPPLTSSDYINTISPQEEPDFPGDEHIELRIRRFIRWNAAAMVSRANVHTNVGGHISTYASAASLYEVGFNHFFRGKDDEGGIGDLVYFQGHAAPGVYARAYLEGRLTESQLDLFRQENQKTPDGRPGLSSYPHPRLMSDFWEFPTVSMGLGPINAIYQARFLRYMHHRGMKDTSRSRVWAFCGDGEMDEPESVGALSLAARENLDNLVFVVNCNLQRLDGPVRGNGKIIQELERVFRGAGWNVIKVVWGREWDPLLLADQRGELLRKLNTVPDGQFQTYAAESGAYIREHFFDSPELQRLVSHLSDTDITRLSRGGHDYRKVYAAFQRAVEHQGHPTVILSHTVKGWTLGPEFEARMATHQMKKMTVDALKTFRDRLDLDISDSELEDGHPPYAHPGADSREVQYLMERRRALGGPLPARRAPNKPIKQPEKKAFAELKAGSGDNEIATTMALVRQVRNLLRSDELGKRLVPIIPDEARTFGMDAFFPGLGIYSPHGQNYEPVDRNLLLTYTEKTDGQILHEGITEVGSMASFHAVGSSYSACGEPMVPLYIFYSMFGFQRTADSIWSAADQRCRGFLLGATAGRTTLNGEGLQHQDGHSLLMAAMNPAVISYDPSFAYEVAVIMEDGLRRMTGETPEDLIYYLTIYNEAVVQPPLPEGLDESDVLRGLYRFKAAPSGKHKAHILMSGICAPVALEAQQMLAADFDVAADVWSAPAWGELRRDALDCEHHNRMNPTAPPRVPFVTSQLEGAEGPKVAVSDWMKQVPEQIARWVPGRFTALGTDGFGRSDTREALRRHFGIDKEHVVVAVLAELAAEGKVEPKAVADAIDRFGIDPAHDTHVP
jgi:pyruvate dehydrogenase E1 component